MSQYNRGGYGGQQARGGQAAPSDDKVANHWPKYLEGGYFDESGCLKIEYVSREKVDPLAKNMSNLTVHQVRRYFGHCRALETQLKTSGASWEAIRPEVRRLDIAVARWDLDSAVAKDPRAASAELNALCYYVDAGRCDRVHLIATETPQGRMCREVVGGWLASRGIKTEQGVEADVLPADGADQYAAAARLRDRVFSVARSAHERGDAIFLNLTGGLKSQTAIAAATATLLTIAGIPVTAYYVHESMPEPVELPILSLGQGLLQRLSSNFASTSWTKWREPLDSNLRTAERERIINVQRHADGNPSSVRLTDFGRFLVDHFADKSS